MHHSTTRLCSSWLRVGLSPVVPTGTSPCVPSAICQFTSARNADSSSEPFLNGVTKAVNDPRKFVLAAMEILRTHVLRLGFLKLIHIGSDGQAKGPRHRPDVLPGRGRYFAAVLAQRCLALNFLVFCPHIQSANPSAQ